MSIVSALYLVLLAAVAGYVLIARVPSLLHTPMLSGSNFIHGIVLAGAMLALSNASGTLEMAIGFIAVTAASANVVGGFIVTDRMLNLFEKKGSSGTGLFVNQSVNQPLVNQSGERSPGSIVDGRSGGSGASATARSSKPAAKGEQ